MRPIGLLGAACAFALLSAAYAVEATGPVTDEKETATTAAAPHPNDALKAGMDPACKDILAHQAEHSTDEVAKCGKPSE